MDTPPAAQSARTLVMIIEDESLLLQAVAKKFDAQDIETVTCEGGQQAFDYLASLPRLPDIIWLDFHLKDMNGVQFMGDLKKNEKWKGIPVVVVTNTATDDNIHNIMALGANKYVVKAEQRLDDIVALVVSMINKKQEPGVKLPS